MNTSLVTLGKKVYLSAVEISITVSSAMSRYNDWLLLEIKPDNYTRIARGYINYCFSNKLGFDTFSLTSFSAGKSKSIASTVRRFLRWYEEAGQPVLRPDPPKPSLPPAYNSLILRFIDEADGLTSLESKKTYQRILNGFFAWVDQQADEQRAYLDGRTVKRYLQELQQKRRSAYTQHLYLSCLRSLADWVIAEEASLGLEAESRPGVQSIRRIKLPTLPLHQIFKDGLSADERDQVLGTLTDSGDRLLYGLLAWGGLRTIEVVRLRREDIDLEGKRLFVTGKGQAVPLPISMPPVLSSLIVRYLDDNEDLTNWVFPSIRSTRTIRRRIRGFFEAAGIRLFRRSAHSLRHTTAEQLLANGMDLHHAQRHLRHAKSDTTRQYTKGELDVDYHKRITAT